MLTSQASKRRKINIEIKIATIGGNTRKPAYVLNALIAEQTIAAKIYEKPTMAAPRLSSVAIESPDFGFACAENLYFDANALQA
jgi:hypothetical protein